MTTSPSLAPATFWPLPKRKQFVTQLLSSKTQNEGTFRVRFQNAFRDLLIYRVPLDMPVYRLANGRTIAAQQEYLAKNGPKPTDFFSKDPDSAAALTAQDAILRSMVNQAGLLKYFRENAQNEPLILTEDGYVINGNRRLCAMRILVNDDAKKHERFHHVRVVILPQCTEEDIDTLEAELQIQDDIKADYSWVDEALLFRTRAEQHDWSRTELARVHGRKETEITELIEMLEHADRYLEKRGWANEYSRVIEKQYAFEQLYKSRKKCSGEEEADLFTELAYAAIDEPPGGDRLYRQIPAIRENLYDIVYTLKQELPSNPVPSVPAEATAAPTAPSIGSVSKDGSGNSPVISVGAAAPASSLDILSSGPLASTDDQSAAVIIGALSKSENRDSARLVIRDALESARQKKQQKTSANAALSAVTDAARALQTAITALGPDSNTKGVAAQLDNVDALVAKLRELMNPDAAD
jgi:hypothetical protein